MRVQDETERLNPMGGFKPSDVFFSCVVNESTFKPRAAVCVSTRATRPSCHLNDLHAAPRSPRPASSGTAWDGSGHRMVPTRQSTQQPSSAPRVSSGQSTQVQMAVRRAAQGVCAARAVAKKAQEEQAAAEHAYAQAAYQRIAQSFAGARSPEPKLWQFELRAQCEHELQKLPSAPKPERWMTRDHALRATTPSYSPRPRMPPHRPPPSGGHGRRPHTAPVLRSPP